MYKKELLAADKCAHLEAITRLVNSFFVHVLLCPRKEGRKGESRATARNEFSQKFCMCCTFGDVWGWSGGYVSLMRRGGYLVEVEFSGWS